jgi:acetyl-CoA C-acetyltransferase
MDMQPTTRPVAVLGGNRIPFARSNTVYSGVSNQEMLTAAIDGLVDRFELRGERLGEVVAGAVLKHSRDFNLTREAVLGSRLAPETPATDIQQACGTGLQAAIQVANKIALGVIDAGVAGGTDTTSDAPVAISDKLRKKLMKVNSARDTASRLKALGAIRPGDIGLDIPQNGEPRTRLSMGEHAALTALEWRITREAQDELAARSHHNLARSYEEGFHDDLITPFRGVERDNNLRPDSSVEKLATLKPVFGRGVRGAAVQRRVGGRARPPGPGTPRRRGDRGCRLRQRPRGPADGSGVRRAADAGPQRPDPAGLRLLRDPRGVRLAGAGDAGGVGGPGVLP